MRRVNDADRLTHRFMVNCTSAQHQIVMAEAEADNIQPGIVARRAFALGLAELHKRRQAVRHQTAYRNRKTKGA